ncbi:hypothetical protein [Micromonospora sp. U21]|uniref:hypothetical protein n=1 Tax=Micromonospora sp. U21 TaxID=2824899 RepID=UPI001FFD4894|nr:hypothetical protein [Micromonospora sp. U21]
MRIEACSGQAEISVQECRRPARSPIFMVAGITSTSTAEWQALRRHVDEIRGVHLRDLLAADLRRGERWPSGSG